LVRIDPVGHPQQGQFAKGSQVASTKVVPESGVDALGRVDVAVGQPPPQRLGGHVDQLELISRAHHPVRYRLPLHHPGDSFNDIVEGLEVLQVDGRDHVDSCVQQLLDVLPALGIAGTGHVRVGQFVDERQLRVTSQQGITVEFFEHLAAVFDRLSRQDLQIPQLLCGLLSTVGVDPPDHDVSAALFASPPFIEHGKGLPYAGSGAKV
jgi:hypothetical protein